MPASKPKRTPSRSFGDLKEAFTRVNSKAEWETMAKDCVKQPRQLKTLLKLCIDEQVRVQQNAGGTLSKVIDYGLPLLLPHIPTLLANLKTNPHDSVKRATMRVLQTIEVPEKFEGEVFDVAMRYLTDWNEAIAIRAYSLTTARQLCERYHSLRHEVLPVIRELIEQKAPTAILSRAKKDLKTLEALQDEDE